MLLGNNSLSGNSSGVVDNQTDNNATDYACISITMFEDDFWVWFSHQFVLFAASMFVTIGLLGNTLSAFVFSSPAMRNQSSNIYLLVLSFSDSSYLISVFLSKTLTELRCLYFPETEIDIMHRSTVACIMLQYLMDLFSDFSTLLILAFTVERFIAVYLPLRFKNICTVFRAQLACVIGFVITGVVIAPYHSMYMGRYKNYDVCTILPAFNQIFSIFYILEVVIFRIVPVVTISTLNVFIIVRVTEMANKSRERKATTMKVLSKNVNEERNQLLENKNGAPLTGTSDNSCNKGSSKHSKKEKRELDKSMQLTIMLILVSSCYIVCYLPVLVHFILWTLFRNKQIDLSEVAMQIGENYTRTLYIFGFAINFFLYTMSGKSFRDQLRAMIPCRLDKLASPYTQQTAM